MYVVSIFIVVSIILGVSYSNFIVTSNNHKAAEMYIGELKYSIEIDGNSTNTLTIPTGETIIDVKVNNLNPVDTYYKLLYLKNSNLTVEYFGLTSELDNSNNVTKSYDKPNDSVTSSNSNTIKLKITNSSTTSQNIGLSVKGGYITNTISDITTPSTYSEITLAGTSTNTYFCTTTDTLTQGLQYVNGQYTYAYKQKGTNASSGLAWNNISNNGWGVQLTDKSSTDAVTSKVCTYINNKPVVSMSYMFYKSQATTLDVSNFNTSKVTNMQGMFSSSQATTLDVSNFNTSKVTNMRGMFASSKATTIDLSNFDTSNVTDMSNTFSSSQATTLDLSNFDTSNVTDMSNMFYKSQATTLDLSNFDTSKVTNMHSMFRNSKATILDVSNFDTSKVTNMGMMFSSSQATTLDVSNFNTSNVTNMSNMFYESQATTLDLSNFDTSKVTNMNWMFSGSQATILDVSNFDTSKVIDMGYMFYRSTYLKTIYVSNKFNTDKVTSSTYMFNGCTKLVGGAGTTYDSNHVDKEYARIDGGTSNPGYFTERPADPSSFGTDSWDTIIFAVKNNNTSKYNVGDTKTIELGTYGTHTIRIANKSMPEECTQTSLFNDVSQTACGFVLEFTDTITNHNMNSTATNNGGWETTSMRTFINSDIYNAMPTVLKNAIIDTVVVAGHGSASGEIDSTSTDKLYLLAPKEIYSDWPTGYLGSYDTTPYSTRTLDYYEKQNTTSSNYSAAIKKNGNYASVWWLRSADSRTTNYFFYVYNSGDCSNRDANSSIGVSPAFRLG